VSAMTFLMITLIAALAVISPGPDFIVVSNNALNYARRNGVYTAIGIAFSNLFHLTYCIIGLSFIASKMTYLLQYIKYLGAAYLIYLGVKALFSQKKIISLDEEKRFQETSTHWLSFRQGALCNALNPKTALFFISIFSLIVSKSTPLLEQVFYGLEISLLHFLWFSFVSFAITHNTILPRLMKFQRPINCVMGVVLIIFAVSILSLHLS
jgi:RhtB (resistance to homoserine/threonine) family protein